MGDFYQGEMVTTLHRLGKNNLENLEEGLIKYSKQRPIALVLPAIPRDLRGDAMKKIIEELEQVKYLNEIILTLGISSKEDLEYAKKLFAPLSHLVKIVWNNSHDMQAIYKLLEENGLSIGDDGKGRSTWISYGYILAGGTSDVIVLHDCDILTYHRELLGRLCYPVVNPNLNYEFCKGYYNRVTDRLHGRATRLFLIPLVGALKKLIGHIPFLSYLGSFRYPLAGEFSMVADLARMNRIPGDWGLEVGVLAQVFKNCSTQRICQAELCDNYEHKHQPLSPEDSKTGLNKMTIDIARSIFMTLANEGIILSDGFFKTLSVSYVKTAQNAIKQYNDDSSFNGLFFDRHQEGITVETFSRSLSIASQEFLRDPLENHLIPNWSRVTSAIPDILNLLKAAVDKDND